MTKQVCQQLINHGGEQLGIVFGTKGLEILEDYFI